MARKYVRILVLRIVFRECVSFEEQIMSEDKYPNRLSCFLFLLVVSLKIKASADRSFTTRQSFLTFEKWNEHFFKMYIQLWVELNGSPLWNLQFINFKAISYVVLSLISTNLIQLITFLWDEWDLGLQHSLGVMYHFYRYHQFIPFLKLCSWTFSKVSMDIDDRRWKIPIPHNKH